MTAMEPQQSSTMSSSGPQENDKPVEIEKRLNYWQGQYILFCAASGIAMDEDGTFKTVSVTQFAEAAGVHRTTLYNWQKSIPNFWQLVDQEARKIFNQSTKFAIMKALKLKAMTGDVPAAQMVLGHYSDWAPPAQKHDVKLGGWSDLVRQTRQRKGKVHEAQVIPTSAPVSNPPVARPAIPAQALPQTPIQQPVIT